MTAESEIRGHIGKLLPVSIGRWKQTRNECNRESHCITVSVFMTIHCLITIETIWSTHNLRNANRNSLWTIEQTAPSVHAASCSSISSPNPSRDRANKKASIKGRKSHCKSCTTTTRGRFERLPGSHSHPRTPAQASCMPSSHQAHRSRPSSSSEGAR